MRVELVRRVLSPGRSGPTNGMYGLQRALARRIRTDPSVRWLSMVDACSKDALPWFWNWRDRSLAVLCERRGQPFVQGPNMLFLNAARPRSDAAESTLLDSKHTRVMFCHTPWYRDLIAKHRGPLNRCPIALWPYPIDPFPDPPVVPAKFDVLIYDKGKDARYQPLVDRIRKAHPRSVVIRYGSYVRASLFDAARRSRACAYLTENDHGPLALQEILIAGCPAIGVRTGASFVRDGETGFLVSAIPNRQTDPAVFLKAIGRAMTMDRSVVRAKALAEFSPDAIVDVIIQALDRARRVESETSASLTPASRAARCSSETSASLTPASRGARCSKTPAAHSERRNARLEDLPSSASSHSLRASSEPRRSYSKFGRGPAR